MKFKVREGFVVKLVNKVELGDGRTEQQESTVFAGQVADLDAEAADLHVHKLEPMDKAAAAYLEAKVLPSSPASALGVTPEVLALAKALSAEIVGQVLAAVQTPAQAPAA